MVHAHEVIRVDVVGIECFETVVELLRPIAHRALRIVDRQRVVRPECFARACGGFRGHPDVPAMLLQEGCHGRFGTFVCPADVEVVDALVVGAFEQADRLAVAQGGAASEDEGAAHEIRAAELAVLHAPGALVAVVVAVRGEGARRAGEARSQDGGTGGGGCFQETAPIQLGCAAFSAHGFPSHLGPRRTGCRNYYPYGNTMRLGAQSLRLEGRFVSDKRSL